MIPVRKVMFSEAVNALYAEWYYKAYHRFMVQENPALAKPFFNRLRNQVLKLAVIHEVAESLSLNVSIYSMKKAIETAAMIEETIFTLLPTGMTREGAEVAKIEKRIREGRADGVTRSALTKTFQSIPKFERTQRIQTVCEGGDAVVFRRVTGGRGALIYVHTDYAEEHRVKFPRDREQQV